MTESFTHEQFAAALAHEERQAAALGDEQHQHWRIVREALRLAGTLSDLRVTIDQLGQKLADVGAQRDRAEAALREAVKALGEIAGNAVVPLPQVAGESMDATAAKLLYDAWAKGVRAARSLHTKLQSISGEAKNE